ncbi:TPA: thioester-forming surface-anchored protein [Streptococcus equi subsp. zooepidemicus]|nr:thioester-forming surface-anchored protein [Streptococcus equi subsp. zooepidemicus]HEL0695390.1 thioester-forming surface-anchored protein [Streptococcus equi subsp. zooepidemicus]HEL0701287.1 thioester-forming surface-anchored protein [Streptococcus equi subsp. zooepidemicus]HEL0706811.1 thioester-forming surface-anchored protein [Streptococcus equi subsp. zooepidemicus]HEL1180598.1 thioester-forming surface-anchored protein [Streptococcus equi subsp. zooepidemicus]
MRKTAKKMLAASTICIIMSGSFIGGAARVLAEQYYGWNDINSRTESPFFLYVTPKNETTRKVGKEGTVVYCFNRDLKWPENWEQHQTTLPYGLPLYNKWKGTDETFKQAAPKFRTTIGNITNSLVAVLSKGYPTVTNVEGLDETSSRKVTQLAIWYFSDSFDKQWFKGNYKLNDKEDQALQHLIDLGEQASREQKEQSYTLDIYLHESGYTQYQNLLGSTLIPKVDPDPEPKPEPKPEPMPKPEPKPQKPTKPSAMASQPSGKALPKTNDTGSLMTALGAGLLSLLGLGFLAKRKRK